MFGTLPPATLYRIAVLSVPEAARPAFLERAATLRGALGTQSGLLGQQMLERRAGPGGFNFVTLAAWADPASIEAADRAAALANAAAGGDRAAFMAANGITAEFATYATLAP